jgi:hypothetical protein
MFIAYITGQAGWDGQCKNREPKSKLKMGASILLLQVDIRYRYRPQPHQKPTKTKTQNTKPSFSSQLTYGVAIQSTTMASLTGRIGINHPGAQAAAARYQEEQLEKDYDRYARLWESGVRKNAGKKFFDKMQFVNSRDEACGSLWQELVCKLENIPPSLRQRFWNERGRKAARQTINRRRQNTTLCIKKRFQGEWCYDLLKYVPQSLDANPMSSCGRTV